MGLRRGDGWPSWTASEWNDALFEYFFVDTGDGAGPVTRLVVTPEELRRATCDEHADLERIRKSFLEAVSRSPHDLKRAFSSKWLTRNGEWPDKRFPLFFVYLVLTCFVASTTDKEVLHEGDFRERLRILVGHPSETSYPLEDLPKLWRALVGWLKWTREAGGPYRELVLPDPKHMTRIGYSVRLAFPARKDRLRLADLLGREEFDPKNPPLPEVLALVGAQAHLFSPAFQDSFTKFHAAFRRGDATLDRHPFWSAIREAVSVGSAVTRDGRTGIGIQLVLETGADWQRELVLMAQRVPASRAEEVVFVPSDGSPGGFEYVVSVASPGRNDGSNYAITLLLNDALERVFPELRSTPLRTAVKQGVLLFRRNESGIRELATALPDDDQVWALVREDLLEPFLSIFATGQRPARHRSQYQSWSEVSVFDGALLRNHDHTKAGPLARIRCLQPTATAVQVWLSGGVPLDGGYLGVPSCLPIVRVKGADSVALYSLEDEAGAVRTSERVRLVRHPEIPDSYEFPDDDALSLDGRFNLIARVGNSVVAQRQVAFRTGTIWRGYVRPGDPYRWLAEGEGPDVVSPTPEHDAPESGDQPTGGMGRARTLSVSAELVESRRRELVQSVRKLPELGPSIKPYVQDAADEHLIERFVECCAGWASNRQGIPESEFLDWVCGAFGVEDYRLMFEIARAWVEGGHFDCLMQRRWRGRVYFARDPKFVVWTEGSAAFGTLMGLAPRGVRNRVAASAAAHGARPRITWSTSPWVPSSSSWYAESIEVFERISSENGLGALRWRRRLPEFMGSLAEVTAAESSEPLTYEKRGVWDWRAGQFTREPRAGAERVEIHRLWRADSPALYQVLDGGRHCWSSYSRNWALLFAYGLAGVPTYGLRGETDLVRVTRAQLYLPVPLARSLTIGAETAPGPFADPADGWSYGYAFARGSDRLGAIRSLWGTLDFQQAARQARWLLTLLRRPADTAGQRGIHLPKNLRTALETMTEVPGASELARARVPHSVVPHVRRLIDKCKG